MRSLFDSNGNLVKIVSITEELPEPLDDSFEQLAVIAAALK